MTLVHGKLLHRLFQSTTLQLLLPLFTVVVVRSVVAVHHSVAADAADVCSAAVADVVADAAFWAAALAHAEAVAVADA